MIPRAIYEALPFVYSFFGLASAINLDSWMGRTSGAMLISASIIIFRMRRKYRRG